MIKTGLILFVMQKRTFASSKDISLEAKRLAQFLLPIGKPNRNPVHSTKIPASLAGNRKRRGFTSLRAHRMAQFEQIRILERMANGNKAGSTRSYQSDRPSAAARTAGAGADRI